MTVTIEKKIHYVTAMLIPLKMKVLMTQLFSKKNLYMFQAHLIVPFLILQI